MTGDRGTLLTNNKRYMNFIRNKLKDWLGIKNTEYRIETIENLIMHTDSKRNGFAVLKKHLNRPDKPLPNYMGKEIEQD